MGHSWKKKKKQGVSGRKSKGRVPSKDHSSQAGDDQDLLAEELTALKGIFQDDIKAVSDSSQTQFVINLRPYSDDRGFDDRNVSALLFVRCLPGYPHRCPKLQIVPEKGLSKEDVDKLFALLVDQANLNSREGRVMIFNLVEAAQEFLSEISLVKQDLSFGSSKKEKEQSHHKDTLVACGKTYDVELPFVCGSIDLFGDLCGGDDVSWGVSGTKVPSSESKDTWKEKSFNVDRVNGKATSLHSQVSLQVGNVVSDNRLSHYTRSEGVLSIKPGAGSRKHIELNVLEEEIEDRSKSVSTDDSDDPLVLNSLHKRCDGILLEVCNFEEQTTDDYGSDKESSSSSSFVSTTDGEFPGSRVDLLMVHLLHLACSSNEVLASSLPGISSELYKMGILTAHARDLVAEPPSVFSKTFQHVFDQHMDSSKFSQFWNAASTYGCDGASRPSSRYLNDFEEVRSLGHGGFGHVALCKNKLDGRLYAVKRIRLKDKSPLVNEKFLREVATLSHLQHHHVVRYYQAWFETQYGNHRGDTLVGSITAYSNSSDLGASLSAADGSSNSQESTYLYIQMEYCPRTLRQEFESRSASFGKEHIWHLFRQIVEGLAHIHGQGIIHRDLTPSNIFFDGRNDIKIGDFGLAKFLKLEQLDHGQYIPTNTAGVSMDGTGQVGTYFYTAPEIEQRWPQINEKVDMYSLGVVFFELWHPFSTAMERHVVLSDLKQKGLLPSPWIEAFPEQTTLLHRLMSPNPSDRPSATEVLQNSLPPRMEDEWLNDILRTMQSEEDTYVYDRVVSSIFDEKRVMMRASHQYGSKIRSDKSSLQNLELSTEIRDAIIEASKEVFKQHGAKRLDIQNMRVFDGHYIDRKSVKILTRGGNMLELCSDMRSQFVNWIVANQKTSFKGYEISSVYRRSVGHSSPNHFLQGDFDIIGGDSLLIEAEIIKVALDIVTQFFHSNTIDIHLSHGNLMEAIWSWVGIDVSLRQNVAELLSLVTSSCPQSTSRKTLWVFIRKQLIQALNIPEAVADKLQTADMRFCGPADQALARLRGALSSNKCTRRALEELSDLLSYLRIWGIVGNISIDVLMPPTESYFRKIFFQVYIKENNESTLFAIGGRYDHLVNQKWENGIKSSSPGAVGISLALEKVLLHSTAELKPLRNESNTSVLVCSRGGGGLLLERMELVAELWQANIKGEFVALIDPSLTEQYEYASEQDIKVLVIITEAGVSQTGLVKVRHLELKKEKEVARGMLVKFLMDAALAQFRNLSIWN